MAAFNHTLTESEAPDGSAAPAARQPWHRPQVAELPPDEAAEARRRIDNLDAARAAVAAQAESGLIAMGRTHDMAGKNRRGRRRGRPLEAVQQTPTVQDLLSDGSQGAQPTCRNAAPRGQSPPEDAQEKEQLQPNSENVGSGGPNVNGKADPFLYSDGETGIVWHRRTRNGVEHIRVTNFRVRIIGDITRDDGVEVTRHYEIAATLNGKRYRFEVGANQFRNVAAWVAERLGASTIVEPGQAMEARVRHAIQVLSGDGITEKYIYAHTGWREIDGQMRFLHAGGALGANGHRTDIEVDLPEQLSRFELIEPESEESLQKAVRASLLLCNLAPMRVMAPTLAAAYRAPLGSSDITVGLWGQTGHGKTETASVVQQHFGREMDAGISRSPGKAPLIRLKTC